MRIYAGASFVVAIAFVALCHDNKRAPAIQSMGQTGSPGRAHVLRNPALLLASAGLFLTFFHLYGTLTWTPPFLKEVLNMSAIEVGTTSMMLALTAIPVGLVAGWIADKTGRMTLVSAVGLGLATTALFLIWMGGAPFLVVAALCSIIAIGDSVAIVPLMAMPSKVVPPQAVGRATGFATMIAYAGSIVGSYLGGFLVTWTGSYDLAFVLYAAAVVIAAVIICPLLERALRQRLATSGAINSLPKYSHSQ